MDFMTFGAAMALIKKQSNQLSVKSSNLYNPALQTAQTISPHYYANGVPYSSTQFDTAYNCTAPIKVKPNTTYTIGLVPAVTYSNHSFTKPWNEAGGGVFFYKSDGTYIYGQSASNTFTTPDETAYIRFNYYIAPGSNMSLSVLNSRCMLVQGSSLPNAYEAYGYKSIGEVLAQTQRQSVAPLWYKLLDDGIEVGYYYGDGKDVIVTMKKHGGNNIFDLYKAEVIPDGSDFEATDRTTIWESGTDCFSPYIVGAANNADGDDTSHMYFTGGNHQYNNTGSGSTATGRTVSIQYNIKNKSDSSDTGYASHISIQWENRIQGYNTRKSDGTGREILKVIHTADFDGVDIKVSTKIIPLEAVTLNTYYGFQMICGTTYYPNVRFLGSTNRSVNTITSSSYEADSGDTDGFCYEATDSNGEHRIEVSIDPTFDLGIREVVNTGAVFNNVTNSMFISNSKVYFSVVRPISPISMGSGEMYMLKGTYKFVAN